MWKHRDEIAKVIGVFILIETLILAGSMARGLEFAIEMADSMILSFSVGAVISVAFAFLLDKDGEGWLMAGTPLLIAMAVWAYIAHYLLSGL